MVLCKEKFEKLLVEALHQEHGLKYVLENLKVSPDDPQELFNNLSIFEIVLSTPDSRNFIEFCIQNGSNFFKSNSDGVYPIFHAINSLCAENVKVLLKSANGKNFGPVKLSAIINEKFEGGNNFLHILVEKLDDKNFVEVFEAVKVLVMNKCNVNLPNDRLESPFYLLLQKLRNIELDSRDLIEFMLITSTVDYYSYKRDEIFKFMDELGLGHRIPSKRDTPRDSKFMVQLIKEWNETKFFDEFENFINYSIETSEFQDDLAMLLHEATARNLTRSVDILLRNGANVNKTAKGRYLSTAFVACDFGNSEVLKRLLDEPALKMEKYGDTRTLLHQICMATNISLKNREKCFDLIIFDRRCTVKIINLVDSDGNTTLHYACLYGFDEIAKDLLRRGAFIGHESTINNISRKVLEEFLDECVKSSGDLTDKNCEIYVDFRFLEPPNVCSHDHHEIDSVRAISGNKSLKKLILHPAIATFLHLKWRRINWLVYFNLFVYFSFMIFLGCFIISFFHNRSDGKLHSFKVNLHPANIDGVLTHIGDGLIRRNHDDSVVKYFEKPNLLRLIFGIHSDDEDVVEDDDEDDDDEVKRKKRSLYVGYDFDDYHEHLEKHKTAYRICVFGIFLMIIYEIVQCVISYRKYFFKLSNWLDICLIVLSLLTFLESFLLEPEDFKKMQAVTILVIAAQTTQLVARVSFLSMSLHMAIFRRVCVTFLKTISLYLILILAFAMSFYTLSDYDDSSEDYDKNFSNPFIATITTIRMMLSDFDKVDVDATDYIKGIIFLLFVVLITIVLFNLLNALAISDTAEIMIDAELVDIQKRVSILYTYEKVFMAFKLSFVHIFPKVSSITIKPNADKFIRINHKTRECKDVIIHINEVKKSESFLRSRSDFLKFWKRKSSRMILGNKIFLKILNFVDLQSNK